MKARYTHDLVATIGEYADKVTGEKKKRRINVGKCFTDDQGRMSFKMDSIPVGPEWSGWVSLYDKTTDQRPASSPPPSRHEQQKANAYQPEPAGEDDIPF
jgi:hypothetical protein